MTQEEQVLILGKCFLYRQKAPFVQSGMSVLGALEYDERSDRVRCHECGNWFRYLGTHIPRAHGILSQEYRRRHGLRRKCALCGPKLATAISAGKEGYYQRLRETTRTEEGRAAFGAIARATAAYRQRRTDTAERRNDKGQCRAQLAARLQHLQAHYGCTPSREELRQHGLSPDSICLVFNLPSMREVFYFLDMAYEPKSRRYTRAGLIEILRDFWAKYGRLPGRAHERMGMVPRSEVFVRAFGSKAASYNAAGLAPELARSPYSREVLIGRLREFYEQHGELPRASRKYGSNYGDALPPGFPTRKVFRRLFGSMHAAYEAAGLAAIATPAIGQ